MQLFLCLLQNLSLFAICPSFWLYCLQLHKESSITAILSIFFCLSYCIFVCLAHRSFVCVSLSLLVIYFAPKWQFVLVSPENVSRPASKYGENVMPYISAHVNCIFTTTCSNKVGKTFSTFFYQWFYHKDSEWVRHSMSKQPLIAMNLWSA